ncbi:CAP domain-containing protein [Aspergillus venezuelensis]
MRLPSIHQRSHPRHHPPLQTLLYLLVILLTTTTALANPHPVADPDTRPNDNIVTVLITKTAIATEIATATVTADTVTVTPKVPQDKSYTSAKLFKSTVLDATNAYRKAYNASALTWNDTLADFARNWAKTCAWEHSGSPYGENLAYGYSTSLSSITAWADEAAHYDFSKPTGFTEETGHFTQLVWKSTRQVGCAAVDCGVTDLQGASGNGMAQGWYVVCEYLPGGNVVGPTTQRGGGDKNMYFKENVQEKVRKVNLSVVRGVEGEGNGTVGEDGDGDGDTEDSFDNGGKGFLENRATGIGWWAGLLYLLTLV